MHLFKLVIKKLMNLIGIGTKYRKIIFFHLIKKYKNLGKLPNKIRKSGSSIGAVIQVSASGVPPGLGEPVFDKIDALIGHAIMSIPAVKGFEIGKGFDSAMLTGEQNADEIFLKIKKFFKTNNAGGTLGGITSGQEIIVKFAVKPTSSILKKRQTLMLIKSKLQ